jgi:hypothetical protein
MFYIQSFITNVLLVSILGYIVATVLHKGLGFYTNENGQNDWSPKMLLSFLILRLSKSTSEDEFNQKADVYEWYNRQFFLKPFGLCIFCTCFWASILIYFWFLSSNILFFDFKTLIFAPIISSYISTKI